jgi:hypothetical protein
MAEKEQEKEKVYEFLNGTAKLTLSKGISKATFDPKYPEPRKIGLKKKFRAS